MKRYIYATYQRNYLKQLLKKTFEPTKESPDMKKKPVLIKLLTLFNY